MPVSDADVVKSLIDTEIKFLEINCTQDLSAKIKFCCCRWLFFAVDWIFFKYIVELYNFYENHLINEQTGILQEIKNWDIFRSLS